MGPNCRSEYHAQKCKATPDEDQRKQRETHPSRDNLNDVTELARDRNPGPSPHYLSRLLEGAGLIPQFLKPSLCSLSLQTSLADKPVRVI